MTDDVLAPAEVAGMTDAPTRDDAQRARVLAVPVEIVGTRGYRPRR